MMEENAKARRKEKIEDYIDASSKSPAIGVLSALIFGPLGCLYASPWSSLVALFVAVCLGLVYWPLIGLVWLGCMVMAPFQVRAFNARVRRTARYYVT